MEISVSEYQSGGEYRLVACLEFLSYFFNSAVRERCFRYTNSIDYFPLSVEVQSGLLFSTIGSDARPDCMAGEVVGNRVGLLRITCLLVALLRPLFHSESESDTFICIYVVSDSCSRWCNRNQIEAS